MNTPEVRRSEVAAYADVVVLNDNWIGALQEACAHFKEPMPAYSFVAEGPHHQQKFTCHCDCCGTCIAGTGTTKKLAQRRAAMSWVAEHLESGNQ